MKTAKKAKEATKASKVRRASSYTSLAFLAFLANVEAVTTQTWKISGIEEFQKGELRQTVINSQGFVTRGHKLDKIPLDEISVWSAVKSGEAFLLGTGNRGVIYELKNQKATPLFETGSFIVSAMVVTPQGTVFAGTFPKAKIFSRPAGGKFSMLCELPESYIWCLLTAQDGALYAGTGPKGRVYRITTKGEFSVILESGEDHVLSLAEDPQGALYAGTSINGYVLKRTPQGQVEVLFDLDEQEARFLSWTPLGLVIGANKVRKFEPDKFVKQLKRAAESAKSGEEATPSSPFQELFDGTVYRAGLDGRLAKLWGLSKVYLTSLATLPLGPIMIGTGDEAKILERQPDGSTTLLADLTEGQILGLYTDPKGLSLVTTGNPGAVYLAQPAETDLSWVSDIKDAKFPARWGRLTWGTDGALTVSARSGNTSVPDTRWSDWSSALASPGIPTCPTGRYLQLKISWKDPRSALRWIMIPYLTSNQTPVVSEITLETPEDRGSQGKPKESTEVTVKWKTEDADGDELVYFVAVQRDGSPSWLTLHPQPVTRKDYKFDPKQLEDGWYYVKVTASDERMNDTAQTEKGWKTTGPILIDNRAPLLSSLTAQGKGTVTVEGAAEDETSVIARVEYSMNGEEWMFVAPADGLYDQSQERFRFQFTPSGASSLIRVRAFDTTGNFTIKELTISSNK